MAAMRRRRFGCRLWSRKTMFKTQKVKGLGGFLGIGLIAAITSVSCTPPTEEPASKSAPPTADDYPTKSLSALGAAGVAKELCSAVFVTKDDPQRFLDGSSKFWMLPEDKGGLSFDVDANARQVTLRLANGVEASASFFGRQGCVVHGPLDERPNRTFEPLRNDLLDLQAAWPIGDHTPADQAREAIDPTDIKGAVDLAFADDAHTLAFLVLHKGAIVAERYAPDIDQETRLPGWSMTKTLQAAIVGRLEQQGRVSLFAPVALREWSEDGDQRSNTTIADLLRMSAPISCGNGDPQFDYDAWRRDGYPYYLYTFSGPADAYAYSTARPPLRDDEPRGYYANCQPHILGRVIKDELANSGDTIAEWAQTDLFAPLGMRSVVLETDRAGNPLTGGYSLATARDWARLGLLYAQDGVWDGERLLSKDFMSLTRAPAPHWEQPIYGGQVWLRLEDNAVWPSDTYQMNGIEGQRVLIIPSRDLVVVRLGRGAGDPPSPDPDRTRPALVALDAAGQALMGLFPSNEPTEKPVVMAALDAFFTSLGAGDRAGFQSSVSEDFTLYEDGSVWGADKIFTVVNDIEPWRRRWTLSQPRIEIDDGIAAVSYRNTLRAEKDSVVRVKEWLESAVLEKSDDGWRVKFIHSTTVPQIVEE